MYAITGITGQVGRQLGDALLADGHAVRAVVRDAAKGAAWAAKGCEVALADGNDAAALERAFTGAEAVFVLLPPSFDPPPDFAVAKRAIAALREALVRAAPRRVVCLSTIGARAREENLLSQLGLLEAALGTLPMPVTFLRAAWFVENVAWSVATARATGVLPSQLQPVERAIPMVSTADVARTAARLLCDSSASGHRVVELEGPCRVSPADLARALARSLGRPVHAEAIARDVWEAGFRAQGMTNPLPRIRMLDGFNEGWIAFEDESAVLRGQVEPEAAVAAIVERG
jgi:uncharacterized protein YbjT (DUF2867 family)